MKRLKLLCVVLSFAAPAFPIDREAFSFTQYELNATIDAGQQRLGVRGKLTVRNDSESLQRNVTLQISSSLHWLSIQAGGKSAQFVTQTYTSDIDHTGALSEAIVTLQKPVAPKETVELTFGYEGVIAQNAGRLIRIGVPAETAKHSDWDEIGPTFTAVRGIGDVAWYPIATEVANMSDASSVSEAVGRWKRREKGASMLLKFAFPGISAGQEFFCNEDTEIKIQVEPDKEISCAIGNMGDKVPFFVLSAQKLTGSPAAEIHYLGEHKSGADDYVLALNQVAPSVSVWLGGHTPAKGAKPRVIDLPDQEATPFQSGHTLLMPLTGDQTSLLLTAVQQTAQLGFASSRTWIDQGLARYVQARFVEQEKDRETALGYLRSHRDALIETERATGQQGEAAAARSLINSPDEFYVQTKAMNVWWMLRDLVGETTLTAALRNYQPDEDRDAMYMQRLLEVESHRDLTWFFNDWVYRDRGLPDFRIASVFARPIVSGGYMVTVTVENLGSAAAEAPVSLQMEKGEVAEKLIVAGHSKASVRIVAASAPLKVIVNDGSVPESDMSNNERAIEADSLNQ